MGKKIKPVAKKANKSKKLAAKKELGKAQTLTTHFTTRPTF
jgi:hypothetical protein